MDVPHFITLRPRKRALVEESGGLKANAGNSKHCSEDSPNNSQRGYCSPQKFVTKAGIHKYRRSRPSKFAKPLFYYTLARTKFYPTELLNKTRRSADFRNKKVCSTRINLVFPRHVQHRKHKVPRTSQDNSSSVLG
ncbi:hypothetical protein Tcan_01064, partial [Toxocara canis]